MKYLIAAAALVSALTFSAPIVAQPANHSLYCLKLPQLQARYAAAVSAGKISGGQIPIYQGQLAALTTGCQPNATIQQQYAGDAYYPSLDAKLKAMGF